MFRLISYEKCFNDFLCAFGALLYQVHFVVHLTLQRFTTTLDALGERPQLRYESKHHQPKVDFHHVEHVSLFLCGRIVIICFCSYQPHASVFICSYVLLGVPPPLRRIYSLSSEYENVLSIRIRLVIHLMIDGLTD